MLSLDATNPWTLKPSGLTPQGSGIIEHLGDRLPFQLTGDFSLLIVFSSVWLGFAFSVWMSHVLLPFFLFYKTHTFSLVHNPHSHALLCTALHSCTSLCY